MQTASDKLTLNPFPWYREMRASSPVVYHPRFFYWDVYRYDDVYHVINDWTDFSSKFTGGRHPIGSSIITMDPPRHRQLRSLAALAFTPRAVTRMTERIKAIVEELLTPGLASGRLDIIEELAYPLPVIVIAEMLGIPSQDRAKFKRWSDKIVGVDSKEFFDPQREMSQYFSELIEQRRQEPRNDLISDLLAVELDGEKLTEDELLGFCVLLLVAGNVTTTNLIGNTFLLFDQEPELWDQLQAQPELIPAALEESVRMLSPLQFMYRRAARTIEMYGHTIKAGQIVRAYIGSANRDETQFPDPDRCDLGRANQKHLAYGNGIHYCMGAPLARLEAKIAFEYILDRFPAIRRDTTLPLEPTGSKMIFGMKHFPVIFERAGF